MSNMSEEKREKKESSDTVTEVLKMTCKKGCCNYSIIPYRQHYYNNNVSLIQNKIKKAGSFIYNTELNKVLLVQSRGQMWGPPKGTMKPDESVLDCAIREVKEETGIELSETNFLGEIVIKSKALYYFSERDIEEITPQTNVEDNDANGIGWFDIECLNDLIQDGKIFITQHCRILIKKIFNKDML